MAMTCLVSVCCHEEAGAVDITNGGPFDWRSFVANTTEQQEIDAMNLEKVFAVRWERGACPQLALCSTGPSWALIDPQDNRDKDARQPALQNMSTDWRDEPLFRTSAVMGKNWTPLR